MAAKMCPIGRCTKINTKVLALCIFIIPKRCRFVNAVSAAFFFGFPREAKSTIKLFYSRIFSLAECKLGEGGATYPRIIRRGRSETFSCLAPRRALQNESVKYRLPPQAVGAISCSILILSYSLRQINRFCPFWQSCGTNLAQSKKIQIQ